MMKAEYFFQLIQTYKEYITRLSIRGYQGVYIEDELSRGIKIEEVISVELRNRGAQAVKDGNIDDLNNSKRYCQSAS